MIEIGQFPDILRVTVAQPGLQHIVPSIYTLVSIELGPVKQDGEEVRQVVCLVSGLPLCI